MSLPSGPLTPNLYVIMVGGPSTGKSQAVAAAKSVLIPPTKFVLTPGSVTRAGLEDFMNKNIQLRTAPNGSKLASNECISLTGEMQGILPDQDLGHLTLYNELYDTLDRYGAVTRTHGEIKLEAPFCSILTGAQPSFLKITLPEAAWGMGFMSRAMMIWDVKPERRSIFKGTVVDTKLLEDLRHDLKDIFDSFGWMKWSPEAEALYNTWWVEAGGEPIPQHARLKMGYNGRREFQMLKLAMIYSLAESSDLLVEEHHVRSAIYTLLEAEAQMHHIFAEMGTAGTINAVEDIIDVVRNNTAAGRDTNEGDLIQMMINRFQPNQIHKMIQNLRDARIIELSNGADVQGIRKFKLGPKVDMSG